MSESKKEVLSMLQTLMQKAIENKEPGQGFSVHAKIGTTEGKITTLPQPAGGAATAKRQYKPKTPKKVTKSQIEDNIADWPDKLQLIERPDYYWVTNRPNQRYGDDWVKMNAPLQKIGMVYIKFDYADQENTGGWKGLKP